MATPFTPDQERVVEGGTPLVENILSLPGAAVGIFSPSTGGMLTFQTGASTRAGRLILWTDRESGATEALGDPGQMFHPSISPDGKRAVVEVRDASNEGADLWLIDLDTGLRNRFTFAQGDESSACWSPDGQFVFYKSVDQGTFRIMQQPVEGQGGTAILLESERDLNPWSVSPVDDTLLLDYVREDGKYEIRKLPLTAEGGEMTTLVSSPTEDMGGGIYSPDGRWVAYHANTAAGWDVFVIPAGGGPRKWQVTTFGSAYPKWNADGTELWVSRFSGDLRAFSVEGSGDTFRIGNYKDMATVPSPEASGSFYDLHPDGERLLQTAIDPAFRAEVSYLHLVTDWKRGLVQ
jgi:Tol biopolymer transport system component